MYFLKDQIKPVSFRNSFTELVNPVSKLKAFIGTIKRTLSG